MICILRAEFCDLPPLSFGGFLFHNHFHMAGDVTVQPDGNVEVADALQRLMQLDLTAIDVESLVLQCFRDVGGCDRPEQVVLLAGLALEGEAHSLKLLCQRLRIGFLYSRATDSRLFHLFDHGLVGRGGLNGQLARQQVVAAVAFGNLDHVAAMAQLGNIFFQNDFHFRSPVSKSFYRAAKGSRAMLRARLMAAVKRRWWGVHTPVKRRGTILPRSATNCCSRRTSL